VGAPESGRTSSASSNAVRSATIDEYKAAGIRARDAWAQSFDPNDVLDWLTTPRVRALGPSECD
jgi:hypothetical protein